MAVPGLPPLAGIGFPSMGPIELILILAVVIIIFGVGRLPEVGGAIGKGIREFRKASKGEDDEPKQVAQSTTQAAPPPPPPVVSQTPASVCSKCGCANAPENRFCGQCGASLEARV